MRSLEQTKTILKAFGEKNSTLFYAIREAEAESRDKQSLKSTHEKSHLYNKRPHDLHSTFDEHDGQKQGGIKIFDKHMSQRNTEIRQIAQEEIDTLKKNIDELAQEDNMVLKELLGKLQKVTTSA
mgnify:CR=1 FL=1